MRRRPAARGEEAVSDTVGSLLLVSITIVMAVGMGTILLSFEGPRSTLHADLSVSLDAGQGGWGTGDEAVRVRHVGGEALAASQALLAYSVNGAATALEGAALQSAFSDGSLTIGETWSRTLTLQASDAVEVQVAVTGEGSQLVAAAALVAGQAAGGGPGCPLDATPPAVQTWLQSPANVNSVSSGAVTVTATLSDGCAGPDPAVAPHLLWRLNDGSDPAYTDAGAMASVGLNQWSGQVPSQPWLFHNGKTLQYHLFPLTDLRGNSGPSAVQSDLVEAIPVFTYVASNTDVIGATADFTNARGGADGNAVATLAEGAAATSTLGGVLTANNGASSPGDVLLSDDLRATLNADGEWVEASVFDVPAGATAIAKVVVGFEGQKSSSGNDPVARIDHKVGLGAYSTGPTFPVTSAGDASYTRDVTLDRAWSVADVEALTVRAFLVTDNGPNLEVDHLFVTVTYAMPGGTQRALDVRFDWTGVPVGAVSQTVDLYYRTAGDTFAVQVWDGTAFNARGAALNSATLTSWTYALTATEYNAGAPRIRFVDATPTGGTAGTLSIDYARVATL